MKPVSLTSLGVGRVDTTYARLTAMKPVSVRAMKPVSLTSLGVGRVDTTYARLTAMKPAGFDAASIARLASTEQLRGLGADLRTWQKLADRAGALSFADAQTSDLETVVSGHSFEAVAAGPGGDADRDVVRLLWATYASVLLFSVCATIYVRHPDFSDVVLDATSPLTWSWMLAAAIYKSRGDDSGR
ncbi:hypothetical protein GCM10009737_28200 [Nocardioides lentus]|uniref:DUF4332 domain-containing protein n=2 Tax=Nocardioides lentus TaxID=338077 RepID=A0ABN2PMB6_9ACTN